MAAPAGAVLSGENGRIVFVSGRADNNDATARIHLLPVPFSSGGGTVGPSIAPTALQHRHPTWSPDRTKIAYARGTAQSDPTLQDFDIFVQDLTTTPNTITPLTSTGDSLSEDRPAWSPDGTKIAYEHQPADPGNDSADRDIRVQPVNDAGGVVGAPLDLAATASFEGKPAWTPDSQTVYYGMDDAGDLDVVREPADNSAAPTTVLGAAASDQFQPSISPDGQKMCYTNQSTPGPGGTGTADVLIVNIPVPGVAVPISNVGGTAEYNCTWSPDQQDIAYVFGAFGAGALEMRDSDGLGSGPDALGSVSPNFDGNPDWAPDGRPLCPDSTVTTPRNTPITLNLECTDTGPAYEQTDPNGFIANDGAPTNGTTSDDVPLANPSTVKYTPNQNFTGTDRIVFGSFDTFGFGVDKGTVTINVQAPAAAGGGGGGGGGPVPVKPKCGGKTATIVGTNGKNTLRGTRGADVIAALGGNDTITGGGGRDTICGGTGRDRIGGGASNDRIGGGSGNDRVGGGSGNDSVKGESGNDSVKGDSGNDTVSGGSGNDKLGGGTGRDRLDGGSGKDGLDGGSGRDRCKGGGGGKDRGSRCEQRSTIP